LNDEIKKYINLKMWSFLLKFTKKILDFLKNS
jgi:hypothetical protein